MEAEQLKEILHHHALWIKNPKEGCRADLSGANLSCMDLSRADLFRAYLWEANLSGTNLNGADLSGVYLLDAKFTVELKDAGNLHTAVYDPRQYPFLALNLRFLESVQSQS